MKIFLIFCLYCQICFTQSDKEIKQIIGATWQVLIEEQIIPLTTARVLNKFEQEVLLEKVRQKIIDYSSYHQDNLISGIIYSAMSGLSLGVYESNIFDYGWDKLPDGSFKDYLKWHIQTDRVYNKIFTPAKIFREFDHYSDAVAVFNFYTYYGHNSFLVYITHFTIKNIFATFVRDYAKYGKIFYSWDFDIIIPF